MKKLLFTFTILSPLTVVLSQLNCNSYNDAPCKEACKLVNLAEPYQGFKDSQKMLDMAIKLCPNMDYAYREKSVPYLKRGDFITWKKLIDKAVEINPKNNLGYRGWCKYQFLRDYKGALTDLKKLKNMMNDIGFSQNGDYNLEIVIGLCYKALDQKSKAIELIEKQLSKKEYVPLNHDYIHLGVLYLEVGNREKAIKCFNKEIEISDYYAETYYYLAMAYKEKNKELYTQNLIKAKEFYLKDFRMKDPYTHPMDAIYLQQIIEELKK
ncbi:tetratricopeptide repeat protein [Chryseobacterium sp. RU37D]|uniref:tetratricopeptide repeat protein n=1 Tax=Chryseobacterium sp. RU37D TaxID=1907397 RepID=UPI000970B0BD|nr:tetratricopeptide repeat protein [Chryseobacterium sp. RU37D]